MHLFPHVLIPDGGFFQKKAKCNILTVICFFCICLGQNYINLFLWLFSWILNAAKVFVFIIDKLFQTVYWKTSSLFWLISCKTKPDHSSLIFLYCIAKTISYSKNTPSSPQNCLTHKRLFISQLPEIVIQG